MRTAVQITLATIIAVIGLSSCLSLDVTLSLREDSSDLTFVYTIARSVWDLGVFDEGSPERAIPVSERDARETAGLHDGVSLEEYRISESPETVEVRVVYRTDSEEALAALWGAVGGSRLSLDRDAGTLTVPITAGTGPLDNDQRELIAGGFEGYHVSLSVVPPARTTATVVERPPFGEVVTEDRNARWSAPMSTLMTAEGPVSVSVSWTQ